MKYNRQKVSIMVVNTTGVQKVGGGHKQWLMLVIAVIWEAELEVLPRGPCS